MSRKILLFKSRQGGTPLAIPTGINLAQVFLEFDAALTTPSAGALTNVVGADWTVVRNSIANYNNAGVITEVAVDVPRIESGKVLIEALSINRLLQSESFNSGTWSKIRNTISTDAINAPDGTLTAEGFIASVDNNSHRTQQVFTTINAALYTMSCFFKAGNKNFGTLTTEANSGSSSNTTYFNLSTGLVGTVGTNHSNASMIALSNGWYLCSIEFTGNASGLNFHTSAAESDGTDVFIGDASTVNLYAWGANLKEGSLSSYIETIAVELTREADVITNTVPVGSNRLIEWLDGVEQDPRGVSPGATLQMRNGITKLVVDDQGTDKPSNEMLPDGDASSVYNAADSVADWVDAGASIEVSSEFGGPESAYYARNKSIGTYSWFHRRVAIVTGRSYRVTFDYRAVNPVEQQLYNWQGATVSPDQMLLNTTWTTVTFDVVASYTANSIWYMYANRATYTVGSELHIRNFSVLDLGVI